MTIKYYPDLEQGSDEWLAVRRGLITASEMHLLLTPTLKAANNDKSRSHIGELAAQRTTEYVEPHYVGDAMIRGKEDEILARFLYSEKYAPVDEMGFITNDKWGFTLGFSPDGLVGDRAFIECKSRIQRFQFETIISKTAPADFALQIQTGYLVSERERCDFISYCGGMPMMTVYAPPNPEMQAAILDAASDAEKKIAKKMAEYQASLKSGLRLIPTERRIVQEMFI